jgi:hypothetical protein
MTNTFPASMHFVATFGGRVALFLRSEGKVNKWDLLRGLCSTKPDGRYAEMVLGQFIPNIAISKSEEIDLSSKPEFQNYFVDGGIYLCTVSSITGKLNPESVRFTDGSDIPQHLLTDQAHAALCLCCSSSRS